MPTSQLLTKIREALKARPQAAGNVAQVCSKIAARAIQIVDCIKIIAQDAPRKEIALDSLNKPGFSQGLVASRRWDLVGHTSSQCTFTKKVKCLPLLVI